jgi:hypothetical protein
VAHVGAGVGGLSEGVDGLEVVTEVVLQHSSQAAGGGGRGGSGGNY